MNKPNGLIRAFLLRAVLIAAVFLILHIVGLRRYTCFLSGTLDGGGSMRYAAILQGLLYVIAYVSCTVIAPILAIAAGIVYAAGRCFIRSGINGV